jgi:hypothetical protein
MRLGDSYWRRQLIGSNGGEIDRTSAMVDGYLTFQTTSRCYVEVRRWTAPQVILWPDSDEPDCADDVSEGRQDKCRFSEFTLHTFTVNSDSS